MELAPEEKLRDQETGTVWDPISGEAVEAFLMGSKLTTTLLLCLCLCKGAWLLVGRDSSNALTQDEGVDVVGAFVGGYRFEIGHMSENRIIRQDSISA